MLTLKRICIALIVLIFMFFAYQCGENKNKYNSALESTTETKNSGNTQAELYKSSQAEGKMYYDQTCAACHGMNAKGLPKLGKDLTASKFVHENSDKELLKFIEKGRAINDPLNTTGVAMPPKGGNPALTDKQIMNIISYLRQLHK